MEPAGNHTSLQVGPNDTRPITNPAGGKVMNLEKSVNPRIHACLSNNSILGAHSEPVKRAEASGR